MLNNFLTLDLLSINLECGLFVFICIIIILNTMIMETTQNKFDISKVLYVVIMVAVYTIAVL